jgi:hypothetical protein
LYNKINLIDLNYITDFVFASPDVTSILRTNYSKNPIIYFNNINTEYRKETNIENPPSLNHNHIIHQEHLKTALGLKHVVFCIYISVSFFFLVNVYFEMEKTCFSIGLGLMLHNEIGLRCHFLLG